MGKFKFSVQIPAKVANPAKKHGPQGFSSAKPLLSFAKMQTESMEATSSLANFSKPLASQGSPAPTSLACLACLAASKDGNQTPSPDLSKILPGDRAEYSRLWNRAWELADYVDGGAVTAPYEDRIARLPELNRMVEKMRVIESLHGDQVQLT